MKTNRQGFTLVEIMIAISIVAVVFGLIISSSAAIRKRSRDAQRQADLRMIQTALQQFYTDRNHFPNGFTANSMTGALTDCTNEPSGCTVSKTYMATIPSDPSGTTYYYRSAQDKTTNYANSCSSTVGAGTCHYYTVCANLEGSSPQTTENDQCEAFGLGHDFQVNP